MGFLAKRRAEEAARSAAAAKAQAEKEAVIDAERALSPTERLNTPEWTEALASIGASTASALFIADANGGQIEAPGEGNNRRAYVTGVLVILNDGRIAFVHRSFGRAVSVTVRRTDEIYGLRGSRSGRNFYVDLAPHEPDPQRRVMLGMIGKEDYWLIQSPPLPGSPMGDHEYLCSGFDDARQAWPSRWP